MTKAEQERLDFLYSEKVEHFLDSGYGQCWLKDDSIAEIVAESLMHFHSNRYEMYAWVIMPNHVHVIVQPLAGYELEKIVSVWKSYTARVANRLLKRSGSFWQREYFDHLLRDYEAIDKAVEYVWTNPDQAGLKDWRWRYAKEEWLSTRTIGPASPN